MAAHPTFTAGEITDNHMKKIKCTDEDGFIYYMFSLDDCEAGIIIGPPFGMEKELHNVLAEAGFIQAPDLMGQRKKLFDILKELGLPKSTIRTVVHIYQKDYY
jgi:hypothetical protein